MKRSNKLLFCFFLTCLIQAILFIPVTVLAALKAGDIVIVMEEAVFPPSPVTLLKVDPQTGQQTAIATLNEYEGEPGGVVIDTHGDIFLTLNPLSSADDPRGKIVKVNADTGNAALLSAGDLLSDPNDLAMDVNGDLIVAQPGQVIRVNRITGAQTLISSFENLIEPEGLSVAPDGKIFVADNGSERVVRINPADGSQTIVFNRTIPVGGPVDTIVDTNGNLLVLQFGNVVQVDPNTGTSTFIAGDAGLGDQTLRNVGFRSRIDSEHDGNLVIAFDNFTESGVARVNTLNGTVTIVTISPDDSRGFTGIAVAGNIVSTNLGTGVALLPGGAITGSETTFEGGVSVASGLPANGVSISQADTFSITASISVDPAHLGQTADLLTVISYATPHNISWFMKSGENFVQWDSNPDSLAATHTGVTLDEVQLLDIFEGSLAGLSPGVLSAFVGYRLDDGTIVFNGNQAIVFTLL